MENSCTFAFVIRKDFISTIHMQQFDLKEIKEIIFNNKPLKISKEDKERIEKSYEFLKNFVVDKVIYGVNTGFGPMAQYRINDKNLKFPYNDKEISSDHAMRLIRENSKYLDGDLIEKYNGFPFVRKKLNM